MIRKREHKFATIGLDEKSQKKYEHMLEKRQENEEKLKASMVSHLSALNDGVIAIFITVMMLEIPYPLSKGQYMDFLWSFLVFLVGFFITANFWYENKRIFETINQADHMIVVTDFMYLASLALIPATTNWIMHENNKYAALTYGLSFFFILLMQELFYYACLRKRFVDAKGLFLRIMLEQVGYIFLINFVLMALAWFYPEWAIFLYIILPIVSFFRPEG